MLHLASLGLWTHDLRVSGEAGPRQVVGDLRQGPGQGLQWRSSQGQAGAYCQVAGETQGPWGAMDRGQAAGDMDMTIRPKRVSGYSGQHLWPLLPGPGGLSAARAVQCTLIPGPPSMPSALAWPSPMPSPGKSPR